MAFNMKQVFLLGTLFVAFVLLPCLVVGAGTVSGEEGARGAKQVKEPNSNGASTGPELTPVLLVREQNGKTNYYLQWIDWPAFQQWKPQLEQMVEPIKQPTQQISSDFIERVPMLPDFLNQMNNMGSQLTNSFDPSQLSSMFSGRR